MSIVKVLMRRSLVLAGLLAASTLASEPARAVANPEAARAGTQAPAVANAPGAQPKVSPYAKANRRRAEAGAAANRAHHAPHIGKAPRSGGARK